MAVCLPLLLKLCVSPCLMICFAGKNLEAWGHWTVSVRAGPRSPSPPPPNNCPHTTTSSLVIRDNIIFARYLWSLGPRGALVGRSWGMGHTCVYEKGMTGEFSWRICSHSLQLSGWGRGAQFVNYCGSSSQYSGRVYFNCSSLISLCFIDVWTLNPEALFCFSGDWTAFNCGSCTLTCWVLGLDAWTTVPC